ncbi:MAG: hypothetical protein KDA61_07190, partial [Planctomycetales bacterium]|nr:hypothetical protein [Planctomycetales bacterium]
MASDAASNARRGILATSSASVANLGAAILGSVEGLGEMLLFGSRTLRWLVTRLPRRDTLVANMHAIGVESLPVVALIGT